MGLIALLFSAVVDAVWPLQGRPRDVAADEASEDWLEADAADPLAEAPYDPLRDDATGLPPEPGSADPAAAAATASPHPLERYARRLIAWVSDDVTGSDGVARRHVSAPGWLLVVGVPVVLVSLAEWILGSVAGFFVFLLHVGVLYLTVGLGRFRRHFSELQLLIGAGEDAPARWVLARWQGTPATAGRGGRLRGPLSGQASAQAILAAYRDVFAPLFWYAVLPGAVGPVLYLFARFAAYHSYPFARTAYYWLDWIPLRLASLGFALAGQFEDTVFCLRAVSAIKPAGDASADPFLHQRLMLLPVAGGALGLRLTDAGVDAQLRAHAPDLDLPGVDPEATSLRPVAGLLLRSSVVWVGLYLLVKLLD